MTRRLTYEFVKESFDIEGYTLLSKEYKNSHTKLECICPKGHTYLITWNSWQQGQRCAYCAGNAKLTLEYVKDVFGKEGYEVLDDVYVNACTKITYKCPEGHIHKVDLDHWKRGKRCPYCAGNAKPLISFVRDSFEKEGYKLLSTEYVNSKQKLDYECPSGHRHVITWGHWGAGQRCSYCDSHGKLTIDEVRISFELEGYTLLSGSYENCKAKLDYICPNGHRHHINWNSWQQGTRCLYCSGNAKVTIEQIKPSFEKEGYTLLTEVYTGSGQKLGYICPEGHQHSIRWDGWKNGHRCPTCYAIRISGSGHPNWQGGKSFEEYCQIWQDQEYKQDIRERDGNKCLNPYCYRNDVLLSIHHIDYNKQNCHPKNLITVCRACNARANFDRKWHKAWYQAILNKRYNYKY